MPAFLLLSLAPSLLPSLAPSATASRRAVLSTATTAAAAVVSAPLAAVAKDKGYMTMEEYNNLKKKELADQNLYGLFESVRERAYQTGEFDKLAGEAKYSELSKLSLAWDSNIRQQVLDKANNQLSGDAKKEGSKISKAILEDLKTVDKLAKAGSNADVPAVSASLRGHLLEFVALEPARLAERYGVGDL